MVDNSATAAAATSSASTASGVVLSTPTYRSTSLNDWWSAFRLSSIAVGHTFLDTVHTGIGILNTLHNTRNICNIAPYSCKNAIHILTSGCLLLSDMYLALHVIPHELSIELRLLFGFPASLFLSVT